MGRRGPAALGVFSRSQGSVVMAKGTQVFLAVDLGASSGRVVAGEFSGKRLALEEVSRFENGGVLANDRLYWDLLNLWSHVKDGLRAACVKYGERIVSVGVDTWGVDFGLLGARDELLGNPLHYRDRRTEGILEPAYQVVPREEIFAQTGLQFMQFNTLFQLFAMRREGSAAAGRGPVAADDAGPVSLVVERREIQRVHGRDDDPVLQPAGERLGFSAARAVRDADASVRSRRRAGYASGACARLGRQRDRRSPHAGGPARHARYGERGDVGARQQYARQEAGLVLHQQWHLVADGYRGARSGGERPVPGIELHERGRRGRYDSPAEEHRRPVAGATVSRRLAAGGTRVRLEPVDPDGSGGQAAGGADRPGRSAVRGPGEHAGGDPRVLSGNRPGRSRKPTVLSCAALSRASPCGIAW